MNLTSPLTPWPCCWGWVSASGRVPLGQGLGSGSGTNLAASPRPLTAASLSAEVVGTMGDAGDNGGCCSSASPRRGQDPRGRCGSGGLLPPAAPSLVLGMGWFLLPACSAVLGRILLAVFAAFWGFLNCALCCCRALGRGLAVGCWILQHPAGAGTPRPSWGALKNPAHGNVPECARG